MDWLARASEEEVRREREVSHWAQVVDMFAKGSAMLKGYRTRHASHDTCQPACCITGFTGK